MKKQEISEKGVESLVFSVQSSEVRSQGSGVGVRKSEARNPISYFLLPTSCLLLLSLNFQFSSLNFLFAQESSAQSKKQAEILFQRGTNKYLEGNIPQAVKDLEKVIELDPQHEQARALLSILLGETASSYYIQGDFARALPLLEKLRKIFPDDLEIKRMYEQASKGAGVTKRSEDVMKFLKKQQQQLITKQKKISPPVPEILKVPKKIQEKPSSVIPKGVPVPTLEEEVNRRVSLVEMQLEKKQAQMQAQNERERRKFLRKILIWTGTFSAVLSVCFVLFALHLKKPARQKLERAILNEQPVKEINRIFPKTHPESFSASQSVLKHESASPPVQRNVVLEDNFKDQPQQSMEDLRATAKENEKVNQIYRKFVGRVEKIFELVQDWNASFGKIAIDLADELILALKNDADSFLRKSMDPYEESSNYIFAHCVNVAILSCALKMDQPDEKLRQIGLAAILHDVGISGKLKLIAEKRTFDENDHQIVNLHKKSTVWILKNMEIEKTVHENVSKIVQATHDLIILTAFQDIQKRKWRSSKRPEETDPFIQEMSTLIAFVEVFEALTHSRPHREAYSTFDAIEILKKNVKSNPDLQAVLEMAVPKFSLGEAVAVKI